MQGLLNGPWMFSKGMNKLTTFRSLKHYLAFFSIMLCILLMAQIYFVIDPHHWSEERSGNYEKILEQDTLLQELTRIIDDLHGIQEGNITQDELTHYGELLQTTLSDVQQLFELGINPEWKSAYKTLKECQATYAKVADISLKSFRNALPLCETLIGKSAKPIFNLLGEIKLLVQTPSDQSALQSLGDALIVLESAVEKILEKPLKSKSILDPLNAPMETLTKALGRFLRTVENKNDLRVEGERLQTLIMNYCATIQQLKSTLADASQNTKALYAQEQLIVKLINDLKIGLQESQKETFFDIYRDTKAAKKRSLLFSGLIVLFALGFFLMIFMRVQRPLARLPHLLSEGNVDPIEGSLIEINGVFDALGLLKQHLQESLQHSLHQHIQINNEKIDRKLVMLAESAVQLSKVSGSIAKIPKIFDQKFTSIYKINDDARVHFRKMVYTCEDIVKLVDHLIEQSQTNPFPLTAESLEPLKASVAQILSQAHDAAVEAQTLGLRFSSLVRTKEDALEVSKLFSKAGTRINQLARSLQQDVQDFFQTIQIGIPKL